MPNNDFVRLELNLQTMAAKMVGAVVEHNSHIADTVRDEVDRMVKDGGLESIVRAQTREAVNTAIRDVLSGWQTKQEIAKRVMPAVLDVLTAEQEIVTRTV